MWTARLVVLCMASLEIAAVVAYGFLLPQAKKNFVLRLVLVCMLLCVVMGVVLGQMHTYESMTGIHRAIDNDPFVAAVLILENVASIAILFFFLKRRLGGK